MSLSSLVQLPVGGDCSQEWILGIEWAGWGEEKLHDWLVSELNLSVPRGPAGYREHGTRIGWVSKKPHRYVKGCLSPMQPVLNPGERGGDQHSCFQMKEQAKLENSCEASMLCFQGG